MNEILYNYIIEILDVHPSVDPCRVFNRNTTDNFQAYTKFSHWLNINR